MQQNRILFFGKLPPPATGENIVSKTIIDILGKTHSVQVINTSLHKIKKHGFYNNMAYGLQYIYVLLKAYYKLFRMVHKEQFQILYFSGCSTYKARYIDFLLIKIARKRVTKIICHLHNSTYKNVLLRKDIFHISEYLVQSINTYICLSKSLSNELDNLIPQSKKTVLPNMIDKSVVLSDEEFLLKMDAKKAEDFFTITYISNFIESKGYEDLAEAVFLIPGTLRKKLKVQFVGAWVDPESKMENFLKRISLPEVKETIQYIGPVYNRKHIKKILTESDIFCLPTYYPVEAQPLCIIEAMNAGNAIISTKHASIPEYVTDDFNGILIEKRNVQQLADSIVALCNKPNLQRLAVNSRKNYSIRFQKDVIVQNINTIFCV